MTITMMTMIIVDNFVVIYMLLWEKGCETECADFFFWSAIFAFEGICPCS